FRYGYLVTTSPQSLVPPSAAGSQKGYLTDFGCYRLSWCDGRCVQGPGTYSARHPDPRLLAIPASCRRIAAYNPNWEWFCGIRSTSRFRCPLFHPLSHVCRPGHKRHDDLTSSPPSSDLSPAVTLECPT